MGNIMRIWHKMRKGTSEIAPILNMLKDYKQNSSLKFIYNTWTNTKVLHNFNDEYLHSSSVA